MFAAEVVDFRLHRGHASNADLDLVLEAFNFFGAVFERTLQPGKRIRCHGVDRPASTRASHGQAAILLASATAWSDSLHPELSFDVLSEFAAAR